jgi:hypothetical protein
MSKTSTAPPLMLSSPSIFDRKLTMKRLFAASGVALVLLLSACATVDSIDGGLHPERQDIVKEMKK